MEPTVAVGHANPFTAGDRITVIWIDTCMAMSHKAELLIEKAYPEIHHCGYDNLTIRLGEGKVRAKHKGIYIQQEDAIWLRGWDLPVIVDSDRAGGVGITVIRGNACYNLCGEAETIRRLLAGAALPLTDTQRAKCVLCAADMDGDTLLYPEITTGHAVVNRMKAHEVLEAAAGS